MKEKEEIQLIRMLKKILPADESSRELAAKRWMTVGKPLFSLGKLEQAVTDIAGMKGTAKYTLEKKGLLIFCADNGVVQEGVTQTGQEVTAVVAENFTKRAASVCLMAERAGVDIFPVDIGMVRDVPGVTRQEYKIAYGTKDFLVEPAMTREEAAQAVLTGIRLVKEKKEEGYEILATGEMGIGNTTTSSAVVSVLLKEPVEAVTGKGAGLSGAGLERKREVIRAAVERLRPDPKDPLDVLAKVGGLDIAGMAGAFLGGALYHIPIVIDGFISAAAALCAVRMAPLSAGYMLPSHVSKEPGGKKILEALHLEPFLICDMCLGEGSGAVAVMPLLDMGLSVYQEMSTFEEIKVEQYKVL
ncbi:nicotinate-nucleotide--dimethylbenzimidazole phosphoribosyltransferase [Mediterraneibacter sp. ICN-202921]|uniref:nicotinate-nucleotide--dimethylbenzimidazole phosphoribosyltransferase n=1 Tax=Mediterraneibacter sp. ICN-202921 TaxID=3134657 RepID=UPI0030C2E8A2